MTTRPGLLGYEKFAEAIRTEVDAGKPPRVGVYFGDFAKRRAALAVHVSSLWIEDVDAWREIDWTMLAGAWTDLVPWGVPLAISEEFAQHMADAGSTIVRLVTPSLEDGRQFRIYRRWLRP